MTLRAMHFQQHQDLTDFINGNNILRANILKIDADSASGGWVMWWYV